MANIPGSRWVDWRKEYLSFLHDKLEIANATEYVETFGEEDLENDSKLKEILSEMGKDLSGFDRVFPANNQDLAVVMINPSLSWRKDQRRKDDNYRMSQNARDNLEGRTKISKNSLGWLKERGGERKGK